MEPNVAPSHRTDHLDAQEFEQMLASPSWKIFRATLEKAFERARGEIERAEGTVEVRRLQGSLSAFRTVLAQPELILKQMRTPKDAAKNTSKGE